MGSANLSIGQLRDALRPGRNSKLSQFWSDEIRPGIYRLGTTYVGCYLVEVEDRGAYTFVDSDLPGYWQRLRNETGAHQADLPMAIASDVQVQRKLFVETTFDRC